MSQELFAGLDLGSTGIKVLVLDDNGTELVSEQIATPWRYGQGGTAEIDADALALAVDGLLETAARQLALARPGLGVTSLAIAGMGETGIVIDADDASVSPGYAWFDPRGAAQVDAFPAEVKEQFAGRTGLPLGVQVTVAKLALLQAEGTRLKGLRWLNLPEYVAMILGGDVAAEYSLTSRTGLLDQDTEEPWPAMLEALDVDASFVPPLREAGSSWGTAHDRLPTPFAGTQLTVAGHDHLVAAEAEGSLPTDRYHVSMGTAEVLLRVIDGPLGYEARKRLTDHLINDVRHIVPGKHVLVAGVKSGLMLRRILQSVGISSRAGRDQLDDEVMKLPYEGSLGAGALEVSGARNDEGVFRLVVRGDGVSPAEIFSAGLRHTNAEIERLIKALDREIPPAQSSLLTGGWVGMRAVQRAREQVLPSVSVSTREQDTAYGAARMAMRMAEARPLAG